MSKFKVGDVVRHRGDGSVATVTGTRDGELRLKFQTLALAEDYWSAHNFEPVRPAARAFVVGDRVKFKHHTESYTVVTRDEYDKSWPNSPPESGDLFVRGDGHGCCSRSSAPDFVLVSPAPSEPSSEFIDKCRTETRKLDEPAVSRLCGPDYARELSTPRAPAPVPAEALSSGVRMEIVAELSAMETAGGVLLACRDMSGPYDWCQSCKDTVRRGSVVYLHRHDCRFAIVTGIGRRAR